METLNCISYALNIIAIIGFAWRVIVLIINGERGDYSEEMVIEDKDNIQIPYQSPFFNPYPNYYPPVKEEPVRGTIFEPQSTKIKYIKIYELNREKHDLGIVKYNLAKEVRVSKEYPLVITEPRTDSVAQYIICWKGRYGLKYTYKLQDCVSESPKGRATISGRITFLAAIRMLLGVE